MKQLSLKTFGAIVYICLCLYFTDDEQKRFFQLIMTWNLQEIAACVANNEHSFYLDWTGRFKSLTHISMRSFHSDLKL